MVDGNDDREVVHRLAAAGRSDRRNPRALELEHVQALRAVFERLEPQERQRVGADVGRAVELDAFEYEVTGRRKRRKKTTVEPARAYLPKTIEREEKGFAVAADKAPGIAWIGGHYVRQLRSSLGRQGVGAQKFLRLLGVETAPRIRRHPRLGKRYEIDPRPALAADFDDGISARTDELKGRRATHTLEDRDSPDLKVVIEDIARVPRGPQRRKRAAALVSTLARAWDDRLGGIRTGSIRVRAPRVERGGRDACLLDLAGARCCLAGRRAGKAPATVGVTRPYSRHRGGLRR